MLKAGQQNGIPCKPLEEEIILLHMITRKRCSWKLKKFWIENKYFFVKCWPFARRDLHTIIWFTRNCSKDKQRWLPHSAASCLWKFFKGSSCCEGPQQKLGVPSFPQIALEQWQRYQLQCKNFLRSPAILSWVTSHLMSQVTQQKIWALWPLETKLNTRSNTGLHKSVIS